MEDQASYNSNSSPSIPSSSSRRNSFQSGPTTMHALTATSSALFDVDGVPLHRHPDLWFEDGSVICRAENTLFFVHMSQLARHSVCFRDMFSIGTHSPDPRSSIRSESGTIEFSDYPVITLHDSAEDLGNLFTALYDGPYVVLSSKFYRFCRHASFFLAILAITIQMTFAWSRVSFAFQQNTLSTACGRKQSSI